MVLTFALILAGSSLWLCLPHVQALGQQTFRSNSKENHQECSWNWTGLFTLMPYTFHGFNLYGFQWWSLLLWIFVYRSCTVKCILLVRNKSNFFNFLGIPDWSSASKAYWHELWPDEAIHWVCGWQTSAGAGFDKVWLDFFLVDLHFCLWWQYSLCDWPQVSSLVLCFHFNRWYFNLTFKFAF